MKKKKGKRIETTVNQLPEAIIQHIQSFLNAKEAARTTLVSKPWYTAWLTRPILDFDEHNFDNRAPESLDFEEFTAKTMQMYQDLNLKIQSFRLCIRSDTRRETKLLAQDLIVNAIKIGATNLELDLPSSIFPTEVLESESITRLSLARGEFNGNCVTRCSNLKSLNMYLVIMRSEDVFKNIIASCCASIEELSLSLSLSMYYHTSFRFSRVCPYELRKLKRLFLDTVRLNETFFSDFASKFPCLTDLSFVNCTGGTMIEMVSTSLECIRLVQPAEKRMVDKFEVPNIRKFTYSGGGVPSLSNKVSSARECEFDISIKCCGFPDPSFFLSLKILLEMMGLSRLKISLCLSDCLIRIKHDDVNNNFGVVSKRLTVESLAIESPSKLTSAIMLRLLGICCPKFITHYWLPESSTPSSDWKGNNESLRMLCNELSAYEKKFGLNEVKVEICEEIHTDEWRPLVLKGPLDASKTPVNKRKVRFQLRWG